MTDTRFDRDQFAGAYPPGIERSWWHVARNRTIARRINANLPRGARLLEVGCGTGIVTCYLHDLGWDVTGVDLGEPRSGLRCPDRLILGQDATDLPEQQRLGVDALLLFDVIEHVADAPAFLRTMLASFPNVRWVVVTVPARKELWTTFDDHFGHFRRYDRSMLRDEFARSGLRTTHNAYFFHALYGAIGLNNLLRGRKRAIAFRAPARGFASMMNRSVGTLMALGGMLLPGALAGSSIIAIGEREPHHH